MKKCLIISLIMMLVILGAWVTPVEAAGAAGNVHLGISASKTNPTVNDNVTVTVSFSKPVTTVSLVFNYDGALLQYAGNNGSVTTNTGSSLVYDYMSLTTLAPISSTSFTFKAKAAGTAKFSISGIVASDAKAEKFDATASGLSIQIKEKTQPKPDPKPDDKPNQGDNSGNNSGSSTNKPTTPTFTGGTATVYAKETVSIRRSWSTTSARLGTLEKGKSITRTGVSSNGWTRVSFNGEVAYISSQYLTTTKPKENDKKDDDKKDDKNNTTNNTTNNETNNTTNNEVNNTTNNVENGEANSTTNELVNNEYQGSNEVKDEKKDNKSYIEFIIIGVIIVAILVIIISEILAKKKNRKKGRK